MLTTMLIIIMKIMIMMIIIIYINDSNNKVLTHLHCQQYDEHGGQTAQMVPAVTDIQVEGISISPEQVAASIAVQVLPVPGGG